jgi:hypothetical protein
MQKKMVLVEHVPAFCWHATTFHYTTQYRADMETYCLGGFVASFVIMCIINVSYLFV